MINRPKLVALVLLSLLLSACQIDLASPASSAAEQDAGTIVDDAVDDAVDEAIAENNASEAVSDNRTQVQDSGADSTTVHPAEELIATFTQPSETNGDMLVLYGQVLDVNETPIANAVVEIWQTDSTGVYDHPGDPGTNSRDTTFQFYGMSTTDPNGWYAFRTIVPGRYEPRPRHIHYKVKQGNDTLLTSQFYFSDDIAEVQGEGMFRAVGESGDLLLLQLVQGEGQLLANGRIVVDMGIGSGSLPLTPSQATGPYYPVVDLVAYDNDLVRLP
ncbi:MAG: hypothetical protein AAF702_27215 [Chloroflexota bacterium]